MVVLQLDLVHGCRYRGTNACTIEILLLWTVYIFLAGADDPCRYTYCGEGTCNNMTGVCDCPEGREGRYCQYQEGGEAPTNAAYPLRLALINKLTI